MEFRGKLNPKEIELIDELVEKSLAAGKKINETINFIS